MQGAADGDWKSTFESGEKALVDQHLIEAEEKFNLALKQARADKNGSEIIKSQTRLADVLTLRNKTAQAQSLYQQVLSKTQDSKQTASILMSLGSIQEAAGDHTAAVGYYQRALNITQSNYGVYSPTFAGTLHALGKANSRLGKKSLAAGQYKQAISILMKDPSLKAGEELQSVMHDYTDLLKTDANPDKSLLNDFDKDILNRTDAGKEKSEKPSDRAIAARGTDIKSNRIEAPVPSGSNVGESQFQLHGLAQAESSHQEKLNADSGVVTRGLSKPYSDASLAPTYRILNQSIADNNRSGLGQDYYERMTAVDLNALGANHPSVGNDVYGLAQFYIRQKQYEKAEPLIKRAYEIYQNAYGQDNILTITAGASQAFVEARLGNVDIALELYRKNLSHSQSALGPNNFETAKILNELAYLNFHQGKLQDARTLYKWAIASTEASVGNDSPLLAACLQDYASVLSSLGESTEATAVQQRATTILDSKNKVSLQ